MTRPPGLSGTPRNHLTKPSDWPSGETGYAPARYAQGLAARLRAVIGKRTYRTISRLTGVSHGTISALIKGNTWPDLVTVALLECGLGALVWPGQDVLTADLRKHRAEAREYHFWRDSRDACMVRMEGLRKLSGGEAPRNVLPPEYHPDSNRPVTTPGGSSLPDAVALWPGPDLSAEQVRGLRVVHAEYQRMLARRVSRRYRTRRTELRPAHHLRARGRSGVTPADLFK